MAIYIDTSALAKRYLLERGSEAFDAFLQDCDDDCVICALGGTEFESILQRLRRQQLIDTDYADQARQDFLDDLQTALWVVRPFAASSFLQAADLMRTLDVPLATLDALHLASALALDCRGFATADRHLSRAAAQRGLTVHDFSETLPHA